MADMINQHIASSYSYKQYYNNEHSMVVIKPLDLFLFLLCFFAILVRPWFNLWRCVKL